MNENKVYRSFDEFEQEFFPNRRSQMNAEITNNPQSIGNMFATGMIGLLKK